MSSTERKSIIVCGASGFIGGYLCEKLSSQGYCVHKMDIKGVDNPCDVTNPDDVARWFVDMKAKDENVFAIVNCVGIPDVAGGQSARDITEVSASSFQLHLRVNLEAAFYIMREYVRQYRDCGGHIINISSLYSVSAPRTDLYDGKIKHPGYVASKSGLVGLSKYCAVLCSKNNIKVNCVAPAAVAETTGVEGEFLKKYQSNVPLGRPIPLNDVYKCVLYVLSNDNITGQNLLIDGGYTLI
jgi:NAD(P)-dependent dehydrogenase (short-subunit alcohol dehydrogenase family)